MKDGFEELKHGIDLAQFSVDGYGGVIIYTLIGLIATVIIQSSRCNISSYNNSIINRTNNLYKCNGNRLQSANIGSATTATLGAMVSNANS